MTELELCHFLHNWHGFSFQKDHFIPTLLSCELQKNKNNLGTALRKFVANLAQDEWTQKSNIIVNQDLQSVWFESEISMLVSKYPVNAHKHDFSLVSVLNPWTACLNFICSLWTEGS